MYTDQISRASQEAYREKMMDLLEDHSAGSFLRPVVIASYDSPGNWKGAADYILDQGEDLNVLLDALINQGQSLVQLAPGHFVLLSQLYFNGGKILSIMGAGYKTIIQAGVNDVPYGLWRISGDESNMFSISYVTLEDAGRPGRFVHGGLNRGSSMDHIYFHWTGTGDKIVNMDNISLSYVEVENISSGDITLFSACLYLQNVYCDIQNTVTTTTTLYLISGCEALANTIVNVWCNTPGMTIYAYYYVWELNLCYAYGMKAIGANSRGFYFCSRLVNCYSDYWAGNAYYGCDQLSCCYGYNNTGHGFYQCEGLVACLGEDNDGDGFNDCDHVVACKALSNGTYGFNACTQLGQNYATGNTSGQYNASYADQASNAAANSAAGGYNR